MSNNEQNGLSRVSSAPIQWPKVVRSGRLNRRITGAGAFGTGLAFLALCISILFLLMESHFLMMLSLSMMLLFYTAGSQISVLCSDSIKLTFSSRHIEEKSTQILACMEELRNAVAEKADQGKFLQESFRFKGRSELNTCIEILFSGARPEISVEDFVIYLKSHFYSDAHEHYQYSASCFEFVGNLMPLFGVAGTLYGMLPVLTAMKEGADISSVSGGMAIAMNSTLYGALFSILFKVLASRFKQQITALNYQFEEIVSQIRFLMGEKSGK